MHATKYKDFAVRKLIRMMTLFQYEVKLQTADYEKYYSLQT